MLADITIDGMIEDEFRQAIETLLREGNAGHAAKWLKSRLADFCGDGRPLPGRFLAVGSSDLSVTGWEHIARQLERLDAPGAPITAVSIDLVSRASSSPAPDPSGLVPLRIETRFYTDGAGPFSHSTRAGLLKAYDSGAPRWNGSCAAVDDTIGIEGIDDLNGAVFALQQRCHASESVGDAEHRAYMLGACYIAVLVHLAVRETALRQGLPRPLAIMVGSNESYPFFDAPVIAAPEAIVATPDSRSEAGGDSGAAPPNHPGLLELRELTDPDADPGQEPEAWQFPAHPEHLTGTQLRKRLVTEESIAELEAARSPNLLRRLFRRQ